MMLSLLSLVIHADDVICILPIKCILMLSLSLEQNRSTHNLYGATEALIIRGQSQAKKRVILFLTVFVFSGFFSKFVALDDDFTAILFFFLQICFYQLQYQWMRSKNYLMKLRIRCTHKMSLCQLLILVCTCFRYT